MMMPSRSSTGGGRQADLLAQFGEGHAPVGLENPQDVAIDLVEFAFALMLGAHRRCPSAKGDFAENSRQIYCAI
jgi:hypothetical protein